MRTKDQILLEDAYKLVSKSTLGKRERIQAYDAMADDFARQLKEVFGSNLFTKKTIYANKDKFQSIDNQYREIFNTEYSLFSFEDTGERLGNLLSKVGIRNDDLKMEEGPKGMVYWFEIQ